jgi:hypothetical protein
MRSKAFNLIRERCVVETKVDELLVVMRSRTVSTNHYLRRLHNLAVGLGWLPWPLLAQHADCLTNAYAVEEARRNHALKAPAFVAELDRLTEMLELVGTVRTDFKIQLQSRDVPILGGAIAGSATHLLTGDTRDFGVFFGKTIQGVKVVSPRLLADELVNLGWLSEEP